jgi:hypothetical protein
MSEDDQDFNIFNHLSKDLVEEKCNDKNKEQREKLKNKYLWRSLQFTFSFLTMVFIAMREQSIYYYVLYIEKL